ncbi:unnamed protein product [Microthlaspi erraticum]|uniref:Uncharacterized protein n=1 Tax=Microthlaspi erraticum TaxID=1685480 RepID=A0A6D2I9F2_9BRAS|nr:unnamed protein product [Microthlaspi erraticum]
MSRKGVIAKRVKTAPDGSIENQRPTAQSGWPRNECSALGQNVSVRLKSRPKSKTARPITHHDPGNKPAVGHAKPLTPRRARPRRASREVTPRGRATRLAYHARTLRPSRGTTPASGRDFIGQISSVRPHRPTVKSSGHDRSDSAQDPTVRPIVPTDRPNAAVDPKPFLKPNPHNSSPKPAPP